MAEHVLTQEPDVQGYGDGLEEWSCTCGESFSAGAIDAAFEHGRESVEKPQVYFSIEGGVGEVDIKHGDVDVVFIDWDNVTPDMYMDPAEVLDEMDDAIDGSMRLEGDEGIQNFRSMLEWLRSNLLDFPENDGYKRGRKLEERLVKELSDRGAHP